MFAIAYGAAMRTLCVQAQVTLTPCDPRNVMLSIHTLHGGQTRQARHVGIENYKLLKAKAGRHWYH